MIPSGRPRLSFDIFCPMKQREMDSRSFVVFGLEPLSFSWYAPVVWKY